MMYLNFVLNLTDYSKFTTPFISITIIIVMYTTTHYDPYCESQYFCEKKFHNLTGLFWCEFICLCALKFVLTHVHCTVLCFWFILKQRPFSRRQIPLFPFFCSHSQYIHVHTRCLNFYIIKILCF